jgi:hypothetical protein
LLSKQLRNQLNIPVASFFQAELTRKKHPSSQVSPCWSISLCQSFLFWLLERLSSVVAVVDVQIAEQKLAVAIAVADATVNKEISTARKILAVFLM